MVRIGTIGLVLSLLQIASAQAADPPPRQMERLGRGLVALHKEDGKVLVSWRLLGTEPEGVAFNLYRTAGDAAPVKVNPTPLAKATCFEDAIPDVTKPTTYIVRPIIDGKEGEPSSPFKFPANPPARPYLAIPLQAPAGYVAGDSSVGDLDGDGEYEIVVHVTGRGRDNSQAGTTTEPIFHAYKLDGTRL